jgi:hypothetical protein
MEHDWKARKSSMRHASPKLRKCYVGLQEKKWGELWMRKRKVGRKWGRVCVRNLA